MFDLVVEYSSLTDSPHQESGHPAFGLSVLNSELVCSRAGELSSCRLFESSYAGLVRQEIESRGIWNDPDARSPVFRSLSVR